MDPSEFPLREVLETIDRAHAPAVANAYAKLTGQRIRTLPFYSGSTMGGL